MEFREVIDRIKELESMEKDSEVAELLGVKKTTFIEMRKRGNVPYKQVIAYGIRKKVCHCWLMTGERIAITAHSSDERDYIDKMVKIFRTKEKDIVFHLKNGIDAFLKTPDREKKNPAKKPKEDKKIMIYSAEPETLETTYISNGIVSLWGYTKEEWLEDPGLWEKTIHPDDRERTLASFSDARKYKKNTKCKYRIIRKDGKILWVEDHFTWIKDLSGKIVSVSGIVYSFENEEVLDTA
jgi:PAS domain S-box-containing protein